MSWSNAWLSPLLQRSSNSLDDCSQVSIIFEESAVFRRRFSFLRMRAEVARSALVPVELCVRQARSQIGDKYVADTRCFVGRQISNLSRTECDGARRPKKHSNP